MPNQPAAGTTSRNFRIEDDLYAEAQAAAAHLGVTLSDEVRDALRALITRARDAREA